MEPATTGALITAGASLLGGMMNNQAHQDTSARNAEATLAASRENAKYQKEFAQSGIRWRVEDAKAAGVHPLAALGAQTASFAPSFVGHQEQPNTSLGDSLVNMGQNVGRTVAATSSREERLYNQAMQVETLKNARLKNELLASQITSINTPSNPPLPLPSPMDSGGIPGQQHPGYKLKPAEITASEIGRPAKESGAINDYGFIRTDTGYAITPSKDAKERTEDDFLQQLNWAIRNQLIPFGRGKEPPNPKFYPLPKGYDEWRWSPLHQEFRPYRRNRLFGEPVRDYKMFGGPDDYWERR